MLAVKSCISSVSYIKPQLTGKPITERFRCISSVSYIKPQHVHVGPVLTSRCISSVSYIKPQPWYDNYLSQTRCISSVSYIKPQREHVRSAATTVVYRPFPTSNHNRRAVRRVDLLLYIVRFLHQTTTFIEVFPPGSCCISSVSYIKPQHTAANRRLRYSCISSVSYIKPQLQDALGCVRRRCISSVSYIKPQHVLDVTLRNHRCISSVSYIKPQLNTLSCRISTVVYRPFPTSNHNRQAVPALLSLVVYRPFPTSNHNREVMSTENVMLYIVRFLHQTTTVRRND